MRKIMEAKAKGVYEVSEKTFTNQGDWACFTHQVSVHYNEYIRHNPISTGDTAKNIRLFQTDGKKECNLLDFLKEGRPLVINFGSNT